ncbi:MAG: dimethylsulfonioproprionate lyase family protein [Albidovulum sp.]
MISTDTAGDDAALSQLLTPVGLPGSGRQRYAAAMHFNRKGQMSDAALEVFRILSPLDGEDPVGLLSSRGLCSEIPMKRPASAAAIIRALIDEADRYIAALTGPGIAEVRAGLAQWRSGAVTPGKGKTNTVVDAFLAPALAAVSQTHPALVVAIEAAMPYLNWVTYDDYVPDEIGADFCGGHAYAAIIGEDAPVIANDWELGLFLIKPHVLYRDHYHLAPELYAPLTGPHGWRFGPDRPLTLKQAHEPVWNPPNMPHLTKVGPAPFLCLFAWTRHVNAAPNIKQASDWEELEALRL